MRSGTTATAGTRWRGGDDTHRQGGELIAGQVEGLQLCPLVDAQGQLGDLVAAEIEAPQAAQCVEALRNTAEVVAGQVHIWGTNGAEVSRTHTRTAPTQCLSAALPARLTRLSRLVGRLLCVRCVFRRCRVCRAVIAGSCLCGRDSIRARPSVTPVSWELATKWSHTGAVRAAGGCH